jgi:diguanylate cyclase (GGDEF)-like protein
LPGGRSLAIIFAPIAGGGWIVTVEDVTERVSEEARIAHMARHDALTGLPNRILFRERLESALALSRRNQPFALLCLDLDRFKAVNDSLGHAVGDALLQAVAERMLATIRDIDTPARLGGDEFAIIQTKLERPEQAANLAERLIGALSAPYDIEGRAIVIGVSIGIALVPADDADAETVMTNGDLALYRAKFAGRGQYCFFEPVMDQDLVTTLAPEPQADAELATG